jgi:hypothetical protein
MSAPEAADHEEDPMREYMVQVVFKQRGRKDRVTAHFIQEGRNRSEAELAALRRLRRDREVRCIHDWSIFRRERASRESIISHFREQHVRRARGLPSDAIICLPREASSLVQGLPKNVRLRDLTKQARL